MLSDVRLFRRLFLTILAIAFWTGDAGLHQAAAQSYGTDIARLRTELDDLRRLQAKLQISLNSEIHDRRQLIGNVEELGFSVTRLESRLNDLARKIDQRFEAIEQKLTTLATPARPDKTRSTSRTTRQQSAVDPEPQGYQQRYHQALRLLQIGNHAAARDELEALYAEDSKQPLAGNILFWLGETWYTEQNYSKAMSLFARAALDFPEGAKFLDSLLKIGLSLGHQGETAKACRTLRELPNRVEKLPIGIALGHKNAMEKFDCLKN